MLFLFINDILFNRCLLSVFFIFWSRINMLLHWNCIYFILNIYNITLLNFYNYVIIYYVLIFWFILFNISSLILFCEISFLNVFILALLLTSIFFVYILHFISGFYFYLFSILLCGDSFMDVLIIRFLLCILEAFSLLCRCIALFLRLFCNLLASHFLLTLFLDFIYFFICFLWFLNFWYFTSFLHVTILFSSICIVGAFYAFLISLDLFSVILQLYILISMLHLGLSDWAITKNC